MEPGHSEVKRILRDGAGYGSEGESGRQEALNGRRTCVSPISLISQDFGVNEATGQNLADSLLPRSGNGSVTNSQETGQVALEKVNRPGDNRVHAQGYLGSSGIDGRAVQGAECTRAQVTTPEQ